MDKNSNIKNKIIGNKIKDFKLPGEKNIYPCITRIYVRPSKGNNLKVSCNKSLFQGHVLPRSETSAEDVRTRTGGDFNVISQLRPGVVSTVATPPTPHSHVLRSSQKNIFLITYFFSKYWILFFLFLSWRPILKFLFLFFPQNCLILPLIYAYCVLTIHNNTFTQWIFGGCLVKMPSVDTLTVFTWFLPVYICCIKHDGSTIHRVHHTRPVNPCTDLDQAISVKKTFGSNSGF